LRSSIDDSALAAVFRILDIAGEFAGYGVTECIRKTP
jgi:hypothetical protein